MTVQYAVLVPHMLFTERISRTSSLDRSLCRGYVVALIFTTHSWGNRWLILD